MLPTALVAVDGPFDFRGGRRIGPSMLNHAYTDLARDDAGFARARVTDAAGFGTEIAWDSAWAQVYTADWPSALGRRHAVAIEPMSCPPDALNSGTDLRVLAPGATTSVAWIIRATGMSESAQSDDRPCRQSECPADRRDHRRRVEHANPGYPLGPTGPSVNGDKECG